jgi:hypothetical protein
VKVLGAAAELMFEVDQVVVGDETQANRSKEQGAAQSRQ